MYMMNHTLGGSDLALVQQLRLSGECWAYSIRGQGVMKLRSTEYTQLAEPKAAEKSQMSVRLDSFIVSQLE